VYEAFASGIMCLYGAYICGGPFLASLWGCAYGEKLGPIGEGKEKRAPPARYLWRGAVLLLIVLDKLQAIKAVPNTGALD
jgi:hypothetical protein